MSAIKERRQRDTLIRRHLHKHLNKMIEHIQTPGGRTFQTKRSTRICLTCSRHNKGSVARMNKSKKRASRSMQLRVLTIKNFNFILMKWEALDIF